MGSIRMSLGGIKPIREKVQLVILGSGWGVYEVLRGVDKKRCDVTMISASSHFNFTSLLASRAVGTLEFRCVVEPVRRYAPQATAFQAWCDKIDFKQKTLTCVPANPPPSYYERPQHVPSSVSEVPSAVLKLRLATQAQLVTAKPRKEFTVHYDKLVIAVGCYSQMFSIPGVKDYGYFLKDVRDARAIRSRILECFEEASQPTLSDIDRCNLLNFCIVGAGPTGIEFAAERHYGEKLARLVRINLYDVADCVLSGSERGLAQYAEKKFARDEINVKLKHYVERVEDGVLYVKEQGEDKEKFAFFLDLQIEKDLRTGSLLTDNYLHAIRTDGTIDESVWAIGDCSVIKDQPLPATAQVAFQKAKYTTRALNRLVWDRPITEPFEFRNQGNLAYLGDWKALYDTSKVKAEIEERNDSRLAWLLWRSAYFTRTLSIRNKITVPYYWFLNWIFGRDITRF
ncbi:hypothetical protein ACEPAF_2759 [Sanghuangporus sanghuang]